MQTLKVHEGGRYLALQDGSPFFLLADTAWELFHRLTRQEALHYLRTRAEQGFNTIQAVVMAENDGLRIGNAYGRLPFYFDGDAPDPTTPDLEGEYSYWDHVDFILNTAEELGLYVWLVPTWGCYFNKKWGIGPEVFTPENAYTYAHWLGMRYAKRKNVLWMLGGDRPLETDRHHAIIDAMGQALRETSQQEQLISFHPSGARSSVDDVAERDYIDLHTVQSSHALDGWTSYLLVRRTGETEYKPFMDSEPRYEDHPACFTTKTEHYWDAADVRQNAYWNLMEGVCGHTYGNHNIWSFNAEPGDYFPYRWNEALTHEGATQVQHLITLRMSRPYFQFRSAPELVADDPAAMAHICAGRGDDYAFAYSPLGQPIRLYLDTLANSPIRAQWFDPRTGKFLPSFTVYPPREALAVPPTQGKGQDWILVLDVIHV